ncbi:peptidase [Ahniella affigens]|uniref:Peptidase n=1 Tax=Ahniella affigens TaxID=2021234 RepID=A0A2P1PVA9_9GAMM|nr:cyanophycinase [Ahniella affigens]AVP98762.1 peptidase [Ahniella affigens]
MMRTLVCLALLLFATSSTVAIADTAPVAVETVADSVPTAIDQTSGPGYALYRSVKQGSVARTPVQPGILMMGGGDYFKAAFNWLFARGGHGHLVVLRASGEGDLNPFFLDEIGGIAAVDTLVFSAREASENPVVLDIIKHADVIFIAGGDQANYVNFWRGTPIQDAINAHVAAGRPLGGTSAGLAIQGAWVYGALDGGSITAPETLADPLGPGNTLINEFLKLPHLHHVITDSHFMQRDRLGRLIGWIARLRADQHEPALFGIGIDEATALAVDGDGKATVLSGADGNVWLVEPTASATTLAPGKPLDIADVQVTALGPASQFDFKSHHRADVMAHWRVHVEAGQLQHTDWNARPASKPASEP